MTLTASMLQVVRRTIKTQSNKMSLQQIQSVAFAAMSCRLQRHCVMCQQHLGLSSLLFAVSLAFHHGPTLAAMLCCLQWHHVMCQRRLGLSGLLFATSLTFCHVPTTHWALLASCGMQSSATLSSFVALATTSCRLQWHCVTRLGLSVALAAMLCRLGLSGLLFAASLTFRHVPTTHWALLASCGTLSPLTSSSFVALAAMLCRLAMTLCHLQRHCVMCQQRLGLSGLLFTMLLAFHHGPMTSWPLRPSCAPHHWYHWPARPLVVTSSTSGIKETSLATMA